MPLKSRSLELNFASVMTPDHLSSDQYAENHRTRVSSSKLWSLGRIALFGVDFITSRSPCNRPFSGKDFAL
jgi:hypothetical protein